MSEVSGHSIANIFHSLAKLNIQDEQLVGKIVEILPQLNYRTMSPQVIKLHQPPPDPPPSTPRSPLPTRSSPSDLILLNLLLLTS
eukprot:199846-Hanusia_phi.AAC.1